MEWIRENAANVAAAKKETFSKIFKNEKLRDAGMREFYVEPTTFNSAPLAPGFGEQARPDDKAAVALENEFVGQADVSFQRDTKIARAVAAEQQRYEKAWEAQHAASTAATQKQTMNKRNTNYRARNGVYQDNWHMRNTW